MIPNNQYWHGQLKRKVAATATLTHTAVSVSDGTTVVIGTRTYQYDLFVAEWTSLISGGYLTIQDAIINDTGAAPEWTVTSSDANSTSFIATVAGAIGNILISTVSPAQAGLSFPSATFTGGIG